VFFNTRNADEISENIAIRNNLIYANGNAGRYYEHNLYIQVRRALYEGNKIGQLVPAALGSSLKDRSSGTVIRYNHIDAATRAIDLVEIEGGYITADPLYPHSWVYGNLITTILGRPSEASTLLIHWGGDNDPRYFRTGTLNFSHNTVLVQATQEQAWYVSLLDLETETERVDARNNLFIRRGTTELRMTYQIGNIDLNDTNWITSNWQTGDGTVNVGAQATVLTGTNDGLNSQYVPNTGSAAIDMAGTSPIHAEPSMAAQNLQLRYEYSASNGMVARTQTGTAPDLGAFEAR